MNNYLKAFMLVNRFFEYDKEKIETWWTAKNPNFGGLSPDYLAEIGRIDKVIQFIESQLDENDE